MALTARIRIGLRVWWLILAVSVSVVSGAVPGASLAAGFEPADPRSWELPRSDLYGVAALGDTVVAVGYWGTVLRSVDGGLNW